MKYRHGHNCPGDDCLRCEQRIAAIEYERAIDQGDDVDDYYDGT